MGSFNGNIISERNQRPSFNGRTILRAYFMRDGEYVSLDNAQVSSVTLFKKQANTSPSSILDASSGLISDAAAADAIWRWDLSSSVGGDPPGRRLLSESDYVPTTSVSCSSIYSVGEGRLAVVLNGIDTVSSVLRNGVEVSSSQQLSGQPAATYIDVWTVKLCAGCDWQTYINDTAFFQNNAVILTEPLLYSSRHRLSNKRIELGSIEKLKIGTEITIENKNIDNSVKNVLRDGLITSGSVEILKHNNDPTLNPRPIIVSFADSAGLVEITQDNTFLYKFNTTDLTNYLVVGNIGSATGTYSVQVKYNVLEDTILSPMLYFTVV